jgi:CHAT domain-containing protein
MRSTLGFFFLWLFVSLIAIAQTTPTDTQQSKSYNRQVTDLYQAGKYREALPIAHEAVRISERQWGKESYNYATNLNNLALIRSKLGDIELALENHKQALAIREKLLPKDDPDYNQSLNNIALLYLQLGNYEQAADFALAASLLSRNNPKINHVDNAISVISLGAALTGLKRYDQALEMHKRAKQIMEEKQDTLHYVYANALNNIADLYESRGDYNDALSLYTHATRIRRQLFGELHPLYINSLNNLGMLYRSMNQKQKAFDTLNRAYIISKQIIDINDPNYVNSLSNLASLSEEIGQIDYAALLFREVQAIYQQQLLNFISFSSQQEQVNYISTIESNVLSDYSFAFRHHRQKPDLAGWAFNTALLRNGLLLEAGQGLYRALDQNPDPVIRNLFSELKSTKAALATQLIAPSDQRASIEPIAARAEELTQKLARQSKIFRDISKSLLIKWPDVQRMLKPSEAAIEFISFRYFNEKWKDSTLYAAFIIRPGDKQPKFVQLFEKQQLSSLLVGNTTDTPAQINNRYRGGKVNGTTTDVQGRVLSRLIWQPLDSLLTDVKTVYFTPAGQLHQVAFAALPHPTDTTKLLSQRYELRQLGSTRLLAHSQQQTDTNLKRPFTAQLYGGIQYSIDSLQLARRATSTRSVAMSSLAMHEVTRSGEWEYLPGTRQEIDNLRRIMPRSGAVWYSGINATEERFKGLSGHSPNVLHVATHGYFFQNLPLQPQDQVGRLAEKSNRFESNENPLLRSGLVLAGANHVWKGGQSIAGVEDGILTALEVSDLNLSGTQLVVLSACETGLGQIEDSEGVFGLQRSFKLAGVKYLLMSLWKVPDVETVEYMTHFYRQLMTGIAIRLAYNHTQEFMLRKYPTEPFKWAAFVLIE